MIYTKYRKAIVAAVGAGVIALTIALGEDSQIVQAVIAVLTVFGVYRVPNAPV